SAQSDAGLHRAYQSASQVVASQSANVLRTVMSNKSASLLALLMLCAWPVPHARAQTTALAAAIEARVSAAVLQGDLAVRGHPLAPPTAFAAVYTRRGFAPACTDPRNVDDLLRAIVDSAEDGLSPADYHLAVLAQMRPQMRLPDTTDFGRAD